MALAKVFSITRANYGTVTSTPQTQGKELNGLQTEEMVVSKLTGDTSGSVDLSAVRRPYAVTLVVLNDNAGAAQATLSQTTVTFTHTDDDTIALSGLGNWTRAILTIQGRSYA